MISAVDALKVKLSLWTTMLRNGKLTHFPDLEKVSENITDKTVFTPNNSAHIWTN